MRDVAVRKSVHLVESAHTLVVGVIGIEPVTGQHINQRTIGLCYLLR